VSESRNEFYHERVLIRTKLNRPELPARQVVRPRLLGRLDVAADSRVALLAAPAGCGKTTLAVQWLAQRTGESAWVSLDSADSDPERLSRYLVAAFQAVRPESLLRTAALLDAASLPPWGYFSEVLISELATIDDPFTLALDDYHTINSDEIHALICDLVEHLSPNLHLLILSRTDPPWPLGRWRAMGWLAEIRQRDLRFETEETRAFFAVKESFELAVGDLDLLTKKTEGWVAGLQLARISMSRAEDAHESVQRFSGSDRLVVDYLMDDVLAAQPPEVRTLWAATAHLERFCAPLCEWLLSGDLARHEAADILARLARENLFLVPLDASHTWFRYHHLFGHFLVHHLPEAGSPEHRRSTARRAAEWFAREGQLADALRLWIEAGDLDAAANYLGKELNAILDQDYSLRLLRQLLTQFPPGAEHGRLPLLVAHAHTAIVQFDLPRMGTLMSEAELCRGADPEAGQAGAGDFGADLDAQRAYLHLWRGEPEKTIEYAERALKRLPEDDIGKARLTAEQYKAYGLYLVGRSEECLSFLTSAIRHEDARGGKRSGGLRIALIQLRRIAGDLAGTQMVAQQAELALQRHQTARYFSGETFYNLGALALERGFLDQAAHWLGRVADLRYQLFARSYQDALIGLALIAERRRDREDLERWTREARTWAVEIGNEDCLRVAESLERSLAARAGVVVPTIPAPDPIQDKISIWLEVPTISHAEILVTHPDAQIRQAALPYIDEAIAVMTSAFNALQALRLSVLRAVALAEVGRREEALDELGRAITKAGPQDFIRPFFGGGARTAALLGELASRRGLSGFLAGVLREIEDGAAPAARSAMQVPHTQNGSAPTGELTLRELETLELVAKRLTNKEIGAQLNITPGAVTKRLIAVYAKLGVHGRREAATEAEKRGILEEQRS
jgi:LuxR family maltose regulon positive regulatory protein